MESVIQIKACLQTLYNIPDEWFESEGVARLERECTREVESWFIEFRRDLFGSKNGYPLNGAREKPELENQLIKLSETLGIDKKFEPRTHKPSLCLTHDIDYLRPTFRLGLKRLLGYRRLSLENLRGDYLCSIERLLELDRNIVGAKGGSTVFVANRIKAKKVSNRIKQWVLDPSYRLEEPLFEDLISLLSTYQCEIGIHGSFFSLEEGLLSEERGQLETRIRRNIRSGRQHWLNLSSENSFENIYKAGVLVDSSLGWNGAVGFRGGMARPFPLCLNNGKMLWEIPLLLMDGPMFDDMALTKDGVVRCAKKLLNEVCIRGGCVALDWHDRAAHAAYGWSEAYSEILDWARDRGFNFFGVSQAIKEYGIGKMGKE